MSNFFQNYLQGMSGIMALLGGSILAINSRNRKLINFVIGAALGIGANMLLEEVGFWAAVGLAAPIAKAQGSGFTPVPNPVKSTQTRAGGSPPQPTIY